MEKNIFKSADQIFGFDLDNTIWDWVKLKNLEIYGMAKALSQETGRGHQKIMNEFTEVYKKIGTPDFSGLIQNMNMFTELPQEKKKILINICMNVCIDIRERELFLYDGVQAFFDAIKEQRNTVMVALSDAPMSQALIRIMRTERERCFNIIFAQKNIDANGVAERVMIRAKEKMINIEYLPKQKPNLNLSKIFGISKEDVKEKVIFVGNSIERDGGLAHKNKCKFLWAKYGESSLYELNKLQRIMGREKINEILNNEKNKNDERKLKKIDDILEIAWDGISHVNQQ